MFQFYLKTLSNTSKGYKYGNWHINSAKPDHIYQQLSHIHFLTNQSNLFERDILKNHIVRGKYATASHALRGQGQKFNTIIRIAYANEPLKHQINTYRKSLTCTILIQ